MPLIGELRGIPREDDPPLGRGDPGVMLDPVAGVGVDQGTDYRLGVLRGADRDGSRGVRQPRDEGIVHSIQDDHPRAG